MSYRAEKSGLTPNYAFNPIAEQVFRSNQTIVPQRVNAALGLSKGILVKLPWFAMTLLLCAGCSDVGPLDPEYKLEGRSSEDLSIAWWKWAMSDPSQANPIRDITGEHCAVNQEGDVWFLAGGFGSSAIRRVCSVPSGKYIFSRLSIWCIGRKPLIADILAIKPKQMLR